VTPGDSQDGNANALPSQASDLRWSWRAWIILQAFRAAPNHSSEPARPPPGSVQGHDETQIRDTARQSGDQADHRCCNASMLDNELPMPKHHWTPLQCLRFSLGGPPSSPYRTTTDGLFPEGLGCADSASYWDVRSSGTLAKNASSRSGTFVWPTIGQKPLTRG
jgi:hypothetical protein